MSTKSNEEPRHENNGNPDHQKLSPKDAVTETMELIYGHASLTDPEIAINENEDEQPVS